MVPACGPLTEISKDSQGLLGPLPCWPERGARRLPALLRPLFPKTVFLFQVSQSSITLMSSPSPVQQAQTPQPMPPPPQPQPSPQSGQPNSQPNSNVRCGPVSRWAAPLEESGSRWPISAVGLKPLPPLPVLAQPRLPAASFPVHLRNLRRAQQLPGPRRISASHLQGHSTRPVTGIPQASKTRVVSVVDPFRRSYLGSMARSEKEAQCLPLGAD